MPIRKADRLLNRINALHKSLHLDEEDKLSTIEKDLMLGYLRDLYEYYYFKEAVNVRETRAPRRQVEQPGRPTPDVSNTPKRTEPTPLQPATHIPVIRPAADSLKKGSDSPSPTVTRRSVPVTPPVIESTKIDPKLQELFTEREDGINSKLGKQPIADLTRALTINNRVLYTRHLFGGNNDLLETSLRTLNGSGSFAAAQPVLESLAKRFDWTRDEHTESAKDFIQLIRRRYA